MERITLARWLSDPEGVIRALFAEGGVVALRFPGYKPNPVQVDYAVNLALALVRGAEPGMAGRVTLAEAGTGTGKTLAILVVGLLNAVLRRRRTLATSFTRQLNRQMIGKDGEAAVAIVAAATGVLGHIALRRPRTAFASPTAARNAAGSFELEADRAGNATELSLESAAALRLLADWTDRELSRFIEDAEEAVADFAGLIESFRVEHPEMEAALDRVPFEHYVLDAIHPANEQAAYQSYAVLARGAELLVATHAALVIDQSRFGGVLDPEGEGFGAVIVDEANRLEDAGRAALGAKRSIAVLRLDRERTLQAIRQVAMAAERRNEIADVLLDHDALCETLLGKVVEQGTKAGRSAPSQFQVEGHEPWLQDLRAMQASTARIVEILDGLPGEAPADLAALFQRRMKDVDTFLDCVDRFVRSKAHSGYNVPQADRAYALAVVDFSPRRGDPSLSVVPKRGGRVVSRLWRDSGEGVQADAVVLTSATLAAPNANNLSAFRSMLEAVGLNLTSSNVNEDLSRVFHLRKLGTMREIVLADPLEDRPSDRSNDGDHRSAAWVAYVADGLKAAYDDAYKASSNRVLVLCTSFDEAEAIAGEVSKLVPAADVVHRRADLPLDDLLDDLASRERAVFVAVGAWDGVDRPGLIDHLVIPRLPFPPPSVERKGGAYSWTDDSGVRRDSVAKEAMLRLLVQGIGRAFRVPDDEAKVWILDPRIGVPAEVELREGVVSASDRDYLSAVPRRFQDALDEARIFRRVRPRPKTGKGA